MKKHIHQCKEKDLDFDKLLSPIIEYIEKTWDIKVAPKGWDEFVEDYEDFKGMPVNKEKIESTFKGMSDSSAGSFPFPIRTSLENVAYGDNCQGRTPLRELLGAILGYGIVAGMKRVGLQNEEGLKKIRRDLDHHTHDIHETTLKVWESCYFDIVKTYGKER